MTKDPIQAAITDLGNLRANDTALGQRIVELTMKIRSIEVERAELAPKIVELESSLKVFARYGVVVPEVERDPASGGEPSSTEEVMSAVIALLRDRDGLPTPELYEKVVAAGKRIAGANPRAYFSTILSRNKQAYGLDVDRSRGWYLNHANGHDAGAVDASPVGVKVPGL